jgi:hypothetical protein
MDGRHQTHRHLVWLAPPFQQVNARTAVVDLAHFAQERARARKSAHQRHCGVSVVRRVAAKARKQCESTHTVNKLLETKGKLTAPLATAKINAYHNKRRDYGT